MKKLFLICTVIFILISLSLFLQVNSFAKTLGDRLDEVMPDNSIEDSEEEESVFDDYLRRIGKELSGDEAELESEKIFHEKTLKKKLEKLDEIITSIEENHPWAAPYLALMHDNVSYVIQYGVPVWVVFMTIILYVLFCFPLMLLSIRFGGSAIMPWIPILNFMLLLKLVGRPITFFIIFFIPVLNLILMAFVCIDLARAFQKPEWIGILGAIPIVNLCLLWYFAFESIMVDF